MFTERDKTKTKITKSEDNSHNNQMNERMKQMFNESKRMSQMVCLCFSLFHFNR